MDCFDYTCITFCIVVAFLVLFKIYNKMTMGMFKGNETLYGKTAIVTGSNTGIGLESAKDLAKRGARVIMVCRDMKKAELAMEMIIKETGNSNIVLKHIDFSSFDSTRKCAQEILREENRIDILLNNAACVTKGRTKTQDGIELMMQTNHFGPFLFTNILLDKIKKSAPSRIVNVSSNAHQLSKNIDINDFTTAASLNDWQTYCYSKLANVYFTTELAKKLHGTGIKPLYQCISQSPVRDHFNFQTVEEDRVTVNTVHPGVVSTEVTRSNTYIIRLAYHVAAATFFKNTKEAAQTSIYACCSHDVANISGEYFSDCKILYSQIKIDMGTAKKVWEISEDTVKLQANERHY